MTTGATVLVMVWIVVLMAFTVWLMLQLSRAHAAVEDLRIQNATLRKGK